MIKGKGAVGAKKVAKQENDTMPEGNDSSAWLEDLVNSYKIEVKGRSEKLEAERKSAQECVEKRNAAVNEAMKEQEAAATKIVEALKDKLNEVSAELEKLRLASADNTTKKDACEDARKSLARELEALKESSNTERDAARAAADTKLKETVAEWTTKLKECEAKNALSAADASRKLDETLGQLAAEQKQLTAAQEALKAEQEVNAKHMEEAATNTKKFAKVEKAIEEACKLLNAALV
jgi:chromosome segregation ATPase